MAHERLSKMDDIKLVHSSQDIRGHSMMDADGNDIGTVDDLVVDTDAGRVSRIVLDDGQEFTADEIEIDNKRAYLKGTHTESPTGDDDDRVVRSYGDAHVHSGESTFGDHDEHYREHHRSTFSDSDDYSTYEPAYRHGHEYGAADRYADRDYDALEPDMRRSYEERHGEGSFDKVKDAVRHSFTHARSQHSSSTSHSTSSSRSTSS